MASTLVPRSRRALLATSAAALLALPATGHAAPKAAYPPPDHPSPAAQAQAAAAHARTPSDRDPALAAGLAQERYYGSYGPATAPVGVSPAPAAETARADRGIATATFAVAVAAALAVGLGLGRALDPVLARLHPGPRRHGTVR